MVETRERIYLQAKSPHCAFVWWDLTAGSRARAAHAAGPGGLFVLRVEEIAARPPGAVEAPIAFDVPIVGATDHWYLSVPASGRAYRVQVGFRSLQGELHSIAASSAATVPPAGPSNLGEERWGSVPSRRRRWRAKPI